MRSSKFQSDPFLTLLASCPLYKFVNEVNIPLVKTAVSNWDQSIFWGVANQAILENEWEQKFLFSITIQWWSKRFLPRHQFICKEGQETVFNMVFLVSRIHALTVFWGVYFHSWRSILLSWNLVMAWEAQNPSLILLWRFCFKNTAKVDQASYRLFPLL